MSEIILPIDRIIDLIDKAHEAKSQGQRWHLGCSMVGNKCDRYIWLTFRFAVIKKHEGRILRLFRRGQLEEETAVDDLKSIGCKIKYTGANQQSVKLGCHLSGSLDGVIESGLPSYEKIKHILEIKTHSTKSFDSLEKDGVKKSKPVHYAQMQLYMAAAGIERALYYAVCKNDDRVYTERVRYDKDESQALIDRAHRIALSDRIPEPLNGASVDWYECKFCDCHDFCHKSHMTKEVNCRTCAMSTAKDDSTWHCAKYDSTIPFEGQLAGCSAHILHPELTPFEFLPSEYQDRAKFKYKDVIFYNGERADNCFTSEEIVSDLDACLGKKEGMIEARNILQGEFVAKD